MFISLDSKLSYNSSGGVAQDGKRLSFEPFKSPLEALVFLNPSRKGFTL